MEVVLKEEIMSDTAIGFMVAAELSALFWAAVFMLGF
jgi:hypothetical protein